MRFFHLKNKDEAGNPTPFGPHTTVGYERLGDNKFLVTFSRCSERDRFNRKRSITICEGRLAKGKYVETEVPAGTDRYEHFINLVRENEQKVKSKREALGIRTK